MRLPFALPLLVLLLVGCGAEQTPAEKAAADAKAVAEVEANQAPPPEPFGPEPIRYPDIERNQLYGAGCSFAPDGGGLGALAMATVDEGYMKRDGEILRFAADKGSARNPLGSWRKYDGRRFSFTLELAPGAGKPSGMETTDFKADLTVRDGKQNVVYSAKGIAQCGA